MKISIKQIRAFLAVAHTLNFAQASSLLNISQPALSITIKGLEDALKGRLFSRSTRRVVLTPEGKILLMRSRKLLEDWDNLEEEMHQRFTLQYGRITIAAMPSFAANPLPPILKVFREKYGGINVTVHDVINELVYDMVRDGRVEVGIGFEAASDDNLNFVPLYNDRFMAVVQRGSALEAKGRVVWNDLLRMDFIALQRPSAVRLLLEKELAKSGRSLEVAYESHQLVTVGRMVANGLGVSVIPALCADQMRELGAACLPIADPVIECRVGMISLKQHQFSAAARALFEVIEEELTLANVKKPT